MNTTMTMSNRPHATRLNPGKIGVYAFLICAALFFLAPLYIMLVTSFKPMEEIRLGNIFALPVEVTFAPWRMAWGDACTGLSCEGIRGGFWNSVMIAVPGTILPIIVGALNGYALALWRPRGANILFGALMLGAFIPVQVMMFPLVQVMGGIGLFGSLPGIVLIHLIFSMPIMTLLFRNYYASIPPELFKAARIDGGGFFRIFIEVVLPLSTPIIVVAAIMQVTGVWNDYILGLVFAGRRCQRAAALRRIGQPGRVFGFFKAGRHHHGHEPGRGWPLDARHAA